MVKESFTKAEEFADHVKEYINVQIDSVKLDFAEKTSRIIAGLVAGLIVAQIFIMFFLFLNISIAYLIGEWLGSLWAGFLIVSGIYFLFGIIIWVARNKLIGIPIMNNIISILFKKEKENEED